MTYHIYYPTKLELQNGTKYVTFSLPQVEQEKNKQLFSNYRRALNRFMLPKYEKVGNLLGTPDGGEVMFFFPASTISQTTSYRSALREPKNQQLKY